MLITSHYGAAGGGSTVAATTTGPGEIFNLHEKGLDRASSSDAVTVMEAELGRGRITGVLGIIPGDRLNTEFARWSVKYLCSSLGIVGDHCGREVLLEK